jgi:hypothetical protein
MNWSNYTSRITGEVPYKAYNSNYDDISFRRFETDLEKHNKNKVNYASMAMRHINTKGIGDNDVHDELPKIFFSPENMNRVQKLIRKAIFERTRGKYRVDVDQDESDLLVAMRAVFLEHARFLPFKVVSQVKELNRRVVEYVTPDMITTLKQTYAYIQEINEPIKPIPRPINVNNAGRRILPSLTSAWDF